MMVSTLTCVCLEGREGEARGVVANPLYCFWDVLFSCSWSRWFAHSVSYPPSSAPLTAPVAAARTKVISYLRQLAVITPFAMFQLHYTDVHDRSKTQKIRYMRRTETMFVDSPLHRAVPGRPSRPSGSMTAPMTRPADCTNDAPMTRPRLTPAPLGPGRPSPSGCSTTRPASTSPRSRSSCGSAPNGTPTCRSSGS